MYLKSEDKNQKLKTKIKTSKVILHYGLRGVNR